MHSDARVTTWMINVHSVLMVITLGDKHAFCPQGDYFG